MKKTEILTLTKIGRLLGEAARARDTADRDALQAPCGSKKERAATKRLWEHHDALDVLRAMAMDTTPADLADAAVLASATSTAASIIATSELDPTDLDRELRRIDRATASLTEFLARKASIDLDQIAG